jgi:RND family efflux transporter MFP subunit
MKNSLKKYINTRTFVFILVTVIAVLLISVFLSKSESSVEKKTDEKITLPVSVIEVKPGDYHSKIKLLGEVKPQKQSFLKSQVTGKIIFISEKLKKGVLVKKGELLVSVESSSYRSVVAQHELQLANAKFTLLKEKVEVEEAFRNWQNSGLKGKADPLTLRKPQLLIAKKEVKSAEALLKSAKKDLSYCHIRSPYDGLIVKKSINIGESLNAGEEIFLIFGIEKAIITVNLNKNQWVKLPMDYRKVKVKLFNGDSERGWTALIVREGNRIVPESRLRQLFMEVKEPLSLSPPLLLGSFLSAELTGKKIRSILELPESALTNSGRVWYIIDNKLSSYYPCFTVKKIKNLVALD